MQNLFDFIEIELLGIGITPDYVGYRYLAVALYKTIHNEELLYAITTRLYLEIAEEMKATPANVERGIRTVISILWAESEPKQLFSVMGRNYKLPPGNGRFIGVLSRKLSIKYRALNENAFGEKQRAKEQPQNHTL